MTYSNIAIGSAVVNGKTVIDTSTTGINPDPNNNGNPCDFSESVGTDVIIPAITMQIPEGFSPNGDDHNDRFVIVGIENYPNNSLEVFNRWGKRVFVSYDMSVHWDGKLDGKVADDGVYFWMAQYKQSCHEDAPIIKSTGFVHLLR